MSDAEPVYTSDPAQNLVIRAYKECFGRQPDPAGLDTYSKALRVGTIDLDQLYRILKASDEYKDKHTFMIVSDTGPEYAGPIAYIQEIYINDFDNALRNVKAAVPRMMPIVVYDDTIIADQVTQLEEAGAVVKYSKWFDNLPMQRNVALQVARSKHCDWVCSSDPDEHYNEEFVRDIRQIIGRAEELGYDLLRLNCCDRRPDLGPETKPTEYYKDLIFKLKTGVRFEGTGNLPTWHEGIVGLQKSVRLSAKYYYVHEKTRKQMLEAHTQGFFIVGGGPNLGADNPTWNEFKEICDHLHIENWNEMNAAMKAGHLSDKLVTFIIKHKDDMKKDGDQNVRAMFQYYYEILHPEENILQLTNIDFEKR